MNLWMDNQQWRADILLQRRYLRQTLRKDRNTFTNFGGLFEEQDENDRLAFQLSIDMVNKDSKSDVNFESIWAYVSHFNTIMTSYTVCSMIEDGLVGIIGPTSPFTVPYIKSVCDVKDIPLIETHWEFQQTRTDYLINLHPCPIELANAFMAIIRSHEWKGFTIIYENDDSLFRITELLRIHNYKTYTVSLRQLSFDGDYRNTLMELKRFGEKNYIIDCSVDILKEVLKQCQQVGIMTDEYKFIILNLDMFTIDLAAYQYGGANITGFRLLNPEDPYIINVAQKLQELRLGNGLDREALPHLAAWKLKTKTALVIDAVKLLYQALKELLISTKLDVKPLYCNSSDSWEKGLSIVNYMKSQILQGITGPIRFDVETGARKDFHLEIIELSYGGLVKVGTWNSDKGLSITRSFSIEKPTFVNENSLKNKMFTVITALTEPHSMLKNVSATLIDNDRFEGFGIDIIHELSKKLQFRYKIILQDDGLYGTYNARLKKWDGMFGKIINGEADFAIADLTITSEREKAVDFTMPFMNLGISILYRKPEPAPPSLLTFAFPFTGEVWIFIGVSCICVSLSFFIMGRLCPNEWTNPFPCEEEPDYLINQYSFRNSLWFTIGGLMQQGTEVAPIGISTRMASGAWYFFILIMVSSYTANLAAFLTVEELVTPFENVEQLVVQNPIRFGAKAIGATRNFFQDSNYSVYPKIKEYMNAHPENMMQTNDEGIEMVEQENYAFFMESTSIEYAIERHCNLTQVGGALDEKGYGIAMKKDSEHRHTLSSAILELQESGKLAALKTKWWKEKRGGGKCEKRQPVATPLDLKNLGGVYFVLIVGTLLGVFSTCVELLVHTWRISKWKGIPFKKQFKEELKFFYSFRQKTKEPFIGEFTESNTEK